MTPLLDAIAQHVPQPCGDAGAPFSLLVTMVEHDNYLGRIATGRVASGALAEGAAAKLMPHDGGEEASGKITRIQKRTGARASGTQRAANLGDIVSVSGLPTAKIGDTVGATDLEKALEPGQIDPPTLSMVFAPNTSPIGRAPGNVVTAARILERLQAEAASSVSLRVRLCFHAVRFAAQFL